MTWRTIRKIAHSLILHARVLEAYSHFTLLYRTDHIFPVLPIKDLINKNVEPTTPYKLVTGIKPLISHLHVLFFPWVLQKGTAHVGTKALNLRHQAQKVFCVISVGISKPPKWYRVYVLH